MVCQFLLYNKVNQLYIYIYAHISSLLCLPPTLPIPPVQGVTKHRADLPVLCGCFPLAIGFTFGSVCMSMPLSTSDVLSSSINMNEFLLNSKTVEIKCDNPLENTQRLLIHGVCTLNVYFLPFCLRFTYYGTICKISLLASKDWLKYKKGPEEL